MTYKPSSRTCWRGISGTSYQVSNYGEVRRGDSWLTPDVDDRGRRRFTLCVEGVARKYQASRLVLGAFVGPCPDGMEACHNNGDPSDNRLGNLRWDTHSNNLLDRVQHGTNVCGEKVYTAKLTAGEVLRIRELFSLGISMGALAELYSVTLQNIWHIINRRTWKHV